MSIGFGLGLPFGGHTVSDGGIPYSTGWWWAGETVDGIPAWGGWWWEV